MESGPRYPRLVAALGTSFGLALAFALAAVPLMCAAAFVERDLSTLVAFAALCLFSLLDPLLNLARPSWWVGALLSACAWIVLFVALVIAASVVHTIGEAGMIFVLPIMGYPVMLGVSGLVRLVWWGMGPRPEPRP